MADTLQVSEGNNGEASENSEGVETLETTESEETSEGSEGNEGEDTPSQKAQEKRKYRVKVDDTEEEVEEEELLRGYQKAKSSDKKFQEASQLKKQIENLLDVMKNDPARVMSELGVDFKTHAEQYLLAQLEDSMLTDEQRELRDLRALKNSREEELKKQKELLEAQENEAALTKAIDEIDAEVFEALQNAGLKATPRTIARVAEQILASLESEDGRMPAKAALERVKSDYADDVRDWLGALPSAEVVKLLPPEVVAVIRAHDLAQTKGKLSGRPANAQAQPDKKVNKSGLLSLDELLG